MRILNEQDKEIQQSDVDDTKGHLVEDYFLIAHHPEVCVAPAVTHSETLFKFDDNEDGVWVPNSEYTVDLKTGAYVFDDESLNGKNAVFVTNREVEDKPPTEGEHEWFEYEQILRYKLYTEDELSLIKAREDQQLADSQERERKNTEYNTLLSSMDDVLLVLAEKEGATSDLENQINDITLVLADLIGE